MKKSLKLSSVLFISTMMLMSSCNKVGPGGTSSIQGQIVGSDYSEPRSEITEVIVTNGNELEHGEYWILNSTSTSSYYYVWYNNPSWVSNGDPQLNGRTGIEVSFNYSDSNTDIAQNTLDALNNNTQEFDIELLNDILRISTKTVGEVPDADKVSSPFEVNIAQQGRDSESTEQIPLIDEKIYISYGDNELYDDEIRTGENGKFSFNGLSKGSYKVFCFSLNTADNSLSKIDTTIEITANKSVYDAGVFEITK